jgi:hypothetical protein
MTARLPVLFLIAGCMLAPPVAMSAMPAMSATAASSGEAADAKAIVSELVACGTRHSLSSWTDPRRGAGCGRDVVARRFGEIAKRTGGRLQVVVDRYQTSGPRTGDVPVPMENVYAVLEGNDPELKKTAFVVSGHLDTRGTDVMDPKVDAPGADDDGSGVAVSILSAAALAGRPGGFRSTLVFAAVAGEEQGLLGAKRLKDWLGEHGYQVGGMITDDIVGATNGSKDRRPRIFSEGGPDGIDSPGRQMARLAEELAGRDRVRLVFRRDRFGRGGDHIPFVEAGLPAIRFTEPLENYDHQHQTPREEKGVRYGDFVEFMDFPFVAQVAAVNQLLLSELAAAPAPPSAVVLSGAVTPSAKVAITAPDDRERQAFEILIRETTEARWRVLRTVPATPGIPAAPIVLEGMSTDNEFFAVRSLGRNGHRSLAVAAVPEPRPSVGSVPPVPPQTPPKQR